ncbi:PREDICTED: photosystem I reaction center subunit N, chloroplastic isoform X1 [Camelina sativa]|uniref:Photosystem I reaction center subunit N, chloroplastic isoform X1 n=1 Tax=Camelina sativa TaxID=90675 RepID=A0ABM0VUL9_CAMSA|nr:PREDICTED: photosystem I reaction center subunit N, chloroplastic isoform X1 [Camelina sativa]
MAAMNSSVLTCSYAISGSGSVELNQKVGLVNSSVGFGQKKQMVMPVIKAQRVVGDDVDGSNGRRSAMVFLAATLFSTAVVSASANADVFDEYLERSKANKELNDKKRLATSGANFARAFTVQFGSCKFPDNFTGCQDLAKQKKVPFISEDLALECEGKDKYKCGSNVFWKW